jgi:hypothetical protein
MIGSRILVAPSLLALALVLGSGSPRPEVAIGASAAVEDAADRALEAINRLEAQLTPAMDAARVGAASVVAGAEDPAQALGTAAERVAEAGTTAMEAREAVAALERARRVSRPGSPPMPPAPDPAELASIAAQLDDTAVAGAAFAETRRLAEGMSGRLLDALDAAAAGEPDEAHEQLVLGLVAVDALRSREDDAPSLTVWIGTADAMIRAMQRLVDAVRAGDAGEAEAARADFETAAEGAEEADRALRIGIGEAGNAVTSVPLGRLAAVLAALDELEAEVRATRSEAGG